MDLNSLLPLLLVIVTSIIGIKSPSIYVRASLDAVNDEETKSEFIKITTMDGHCNGSICSDFCYKNIAQVAFFDLKAEVRITEYSTYDISPLEYDTLVFDQSVFAHFPLNLFYSINMQELDIRNCSIEIVTWESFLMADKLRILLLSENKLRTISEMTFNYASNLQYLFLNSNHLHTLVSESFKGLNKLKYLDLRNNKLEELPAGICDYLPVLQELRLDHNLFQTISNDIFTKLPLLITLTLNDNQLYGIDENAFQRQTNLAVLDISNNKNLTTILVTLQVRNLIAANCSLNRVNIYGSVKNVDLRDNKILELYFSQPENLETLNLKSNSLQQIASLTRAINLRVLNLADNPKIGGSLPDPWNVNSLVRLDLSNTGLTQLPISSLAEQPNLRFLNASNNSLREINPQNFIYLEQLSHFDIHANDWNCYNLHMVMQMLLQPRHISYARDAFDPEFPGEYINGIACMYKLEEEMASSQSSQMENMVIKADNLYQLDLLNELEKLRSELKAVNSINEQKFDMLFKIIRDLNNRLEVFETLNETYWKDMTITV